MQPSVGFMSGWEMCRKIALPAPRFRGLMFQSSTTQTSYSLSFRFIFSWLAAKGRQTGRL